MKHLFGLEEEWPLQDLIGFSHEFDTWLVTAAYQSGVFPMPLLNTQYAYEMGWWSPLKRGILPLTGLHVTRSLRKTAARYTTTVDVAFDEVITRCANPERDGAWITEQIIDVYTGLHRDGIAHSVETWNDAGDLVGGLYGLSFGGLFAGESMFHDRELGRDASKVALMRLVDELARGCDPDRLDEHRLLDVQWSTPHLASLGVIEISRHDYLERLNTALGQRRPRLRIGERLHGTAPVARLAELTQHDPGADHA